MKAEAIAFVIRQVSAQKWEVRDHRNTLLGEFRTRDRAGELVRKLQEADAFAKQFAKEHP